MQVQSQGAGRQVNHLEGAGLPIITQTTPHQAAFPTKADEGSLSRDKEDQDVGGCSCKTISLW